MTAIELTHFARALLTTILDADLRAVVAEAQASVLPADERAAFLGFAGLPEPSHAD